MKDGGYEIKADYTSELQNYKVETGTVGKEQLNRVDLYVDSNDLTKFYGMPREYWMVWTVRNGIP